MARQRTLVLMVGLIFAPCAYAYIDPGTGTFAVQMLLAALAGSLFYIKTIIHRIKRLLGLAPDKPERKPIPADSDSDSAKP